MNKTERVDSPTIMFPDRGPISACFAWAMVLQAIWIGCPFTGCVCADGRIKLFCDAHESSLDQHHESILSTGDCCYRKAAPSQKRAPRSDCCDRKAVRERSGDGCTPLKNALIVLLASDSKYFSSDRAAALHTLAFGPAGNSFIHTSFAPSQPPEGTTGPPGNLILRLHRLLI